MSASGPVIDPTVAPAAMCPGFADPALFAPAPGDGSSAPAPGVGSSAPAPGDGSSAPAPGDGSAAALPPRLPPPIHPRRPTPFHPWRTGRSTPGVPAAAAALLIMALTAR
jgi:hypothetical protein